MGLLTHAPVTSLVDGDFRLVPMKPLPEGQEWKDIIGFDPHTNFSGTLVADSYRMKVSARTNAPLSKNDRLIDPDDPSWTIPHGVHIDFNRVPMYIVPGPLLLLWLFFNGVPMPKGSSQEDLMDQVQRAIDEGQPIDEDRIKSDDSTPHVPTFHSIR
ncbi:hypothetical protein ACHAWF_000278 [Thalassiosira exigua]